MAEGRRAIGNGWVRPWIQLVEIGFSAPIVIGYRTARVLTSGWPPSRRERRELARMIREKGSAFGAAAAAAVTTPPADAASLVGDVLAPVHRTVVANRRRLAGR